MKKLEFRKWLMVLLTASGLIFSITAMGEEKENHSGSSKYCALILKKLAGPKATFSGKLYFFTTVRKTEYLEQPAGGYIYENPTSVSFGIRFTMPLIDQREKLQRLKDYLNRLKTAGNLLNQYLTLRREIEATEKFLTWQWARVCHGIEYKKQIWELQIELETKKETLKVLENQLCLAGVPKSWLDACYRERVIEIPLSPKPLGVPDCLNATNEGN